ncbi:hypothetical protein ABK040_004527 [Willaertia magna]
MVNPVLNNYHHAKATDKRKKSKLTETIKRIAEENFQSFIQTDSVDLVIDPILIVDNDFIINSKLYHENKSKEEELQQQREKTLQDEFKKKITYYTSLDNNDENTSILWKEDEEDIHPHNEKLNSQLMNKFFSALHLDYNNQLHRGLVISTSSFIVCCATHLCLDKFIWKRIVNLNKISSRDRIFLSERLVSVMHGLAVAFLAAKILLIDKAYDRDPKKDFVSIWKTYPMPISDWMFSISTGYEVYDMITMLAQGSKDPKMWLHHIFTFLGTSLSMWYKEATFLSTCLLFSEFTVLPTNINWFIRLFEKDKVKGSFGSRIYELNLLVRLLFYIVFRLGVGPVAFMKLIPHYSRIWEITWTAKVFSHLVTILISVFNAQWSWIVIKDYLKRVKLNRRRKDETLGIRL